MRKQQGGFTLIELVMVIVILGILAASFAPKFVDLGDGATNAARLAASGAVRAALTVAIAENKTTPTIATLVGYVQGGTPTAVNTGVQMTIKNKTGGSDVFIVPTFTGGDCTGATANTGVDKVACVGDAALIP